MNQVATVARVATAEEKTEDSASEWISIGFKNFFSGTAAAQHQPCRSLCLRANLVLTAFSIQHQWAHLKSGLSRAVVVMRIHLSLSVFCAIFLCKWQGEIGIVVVDRQRQSGRAKQERRSRRRDSQSVSVQRR